MRFILCTDIEILSIQKQIKMKKLQVNKNIFYFELSSKPNFGIVDIAVYMWENIILKSSSLLMMLRIFKMVLARYLGPEKCYTILDILYGPLISWPPTNQLTSQVKITIQQSAPSSHEYAELQALHLGNHKSMWL